MANLDTLCNNTNIIQKENDPKLITRKSNNNISTSSYCFLYSITGWPLSADSVIVTQEF